MEMFVVYWNPTDYPRKYVVRRFIIQSQPIPDREPWIVRDTLEGARETILYGLVHVPRAPSDGAVILEVWF